MARGDATVPMITRALRVEIVKPLNATWDDFGTTLRVQSRIVPQLLRAGMDARIACGVASAETIKQALGIEARGQSAGTVVYQAMKAELEKIRGGKWAPECRPALEIPGGTLSALSQRVSQSYPKRPSFKGSQPIPVRAAESSLALDPDGSAVLRVKLRSEGHYHLLVKAGKGSHWGRLRALAQGKSGLKLGEVRIKSSGEGKRRKWHAFIAYSEPRPQLPDRCRPEHVMVLHRGQRNLLVCATNEGKFLVIATGNKLRAQKRAFKRRREELQSRSYAERGKCSRGHGRKRRYETTEAISKAEANCVKTLCQQLGARVAQLAKEWGCGTVLIEDYGGIEPGADRGKRMYLERFPNHELKEAVGWALTKTGLSLGEYPHEYISQTCPACSNVDAAQHNARTGVFHCKACAFDAEVDRVSCIHALRRACDGDAGVWEKRLEVIADLRGKNGRKKGKT